MTIDIFSLKDLTPDLTPSLIGLLILTLIVFLLVRETVSLFLYFLTGLFLTGLSLAITGDPISSLTVFSLWGLLTLTDCLKSPSLS